MRYFFLPFAAPVLAFAVALPLTATSAAPSPKRIATPPARSFAPTSATVVQIENFTFSPPTLQVKAGTTVTWTNDDDIPHNVVARSGAFRSKVLDTGDSFSFTFKSAGEFVYFCALHPHMIGKIVVTA